MTSLNDAVFQVYRYVAGKKKWLSPTVVECEVVQGKIASCDASPNKQKYVLLYATTYAASDCCVKEVDGGLTLELHVQDGATEGQLNWHYHVFESEPPPAPDGHLIVWNGGQRESINGTQDPDWKTHLDHDVGECT